MVQKKAEAAISQSLDSFEAIPICWEGGSSLGNSEVSGCLGKFGTMMETGVSQFEVFLSERAKRLSQ